MKYPILFLSVFIFGCDQNSDLDNLANYLGKEQFEILDRTVNSFDSFLETNYDSLDIHDRTIAFLNDVLTYRINTISWEYDPHEAIAIVNDFETSGLRKELWLYDFEEYEDQEVIAYSLFISDSLYQAPDSIQIDLREVDTVFVDLMEIPPFENFDEQPKNEIDSTRRAFKFSKIIVGIHKFSSDQQLREYCEANFLVRAERLLVANAFIKNSNDMDFNSFFTKAVLVIEFYYDLLYSIAQQKKTAPNNM